MIFSRLPSLNGAAGNTEVRSKCPLGYSFPLTNALDSFRRINGQWLDFKVGMFALKYCHVSLRIFNRFIERGRQHGKGCTHSKNLLCFLKPLNLFFEQGTFRGRKIVLLIFGKDGKQIDTFVLFKANIADTDTAALSAMFIGKPHLAQASRPLNDITDFGIL